MRRFWLLVLFQVFVIQLPGQRLPLIDSGALLKHSDVLADSGKLDLAIKELLKVPQRDTNYVWAQARMAELYNSNKQYDEAIAIVDRFMNRKDKFRTSFLSSKASALEGKEAYDQAISFIQSALKEYPYHTQLRYQLAATYHNKLDYQNAVKAYFDVLEIAPFHSNTHLNLGVISLWTGQKTHAMMSYGMYLAIKNTDNGRLVTLENLSSNQATNEGASKDKAGPNAFEKLDQILRSKVAMDKKFKTKVPVDAALVKQFEMLFQQLNTASATTEEPWLKFYLPVYQAMRDQKLIEPFLYHILSSANIDAVKKWTAKNDKALQSFYSGVNAALTRDRVHVRAPESLGLGPTTYAEYNNQHVLIGVGGRSNGKEHGKWIYYHTNGEKAAEGVFENGVKKGVWNYYLRDGVLNSSENEDTGEIIKWFPGGGKQYTYFLKNDKIEGEFVFYYPCGEVSERRTHKDGKRHGKGQLFHATGVKSADFEYLDGELTGSWIDYDVFGKVTTRSEFKNGQRDGVSESFFSNGKLKERELWKEGKRSGPAEGHFSNGKPWYKGNYVNDDAVGEWLYYNRYGQQVEKRTYGADGKLDGETSYYHDGKLYYTATMDNGKVIGVTYYDKSGKEIWKGGSPDGNFEVKHFFAYGQLLSEGRYKDGTRDGKWNQYYINGALMSTYNYVEGQFDGKQFDYYQNGKEKIVSTFKAGVHDGYYEEFHINGKLEKEGWYVNGDAEQQWKLYNPDGSVSEDLYYMHNKLFDTAYLYSAEGELSGKNFYQDGVAVIENAWNSERTVFTIDKTKTEKYDFKYGNGNSMTTYDLNCGLLNGGLDRFYPDGKPFYMLTYVGGVLHGPVASYDLNGVLHRSAAYNAGEETGVWTYRNEINKVDRIIRYVDGKIDSVLTAYYETGPLFFTAEYRDGERNGVTSFYAPNGARLVDKLYEGGQIASIRAADKSGQFGEWMPMKLSMTVVAYYPNGTKAYEEKFENGLITGKKTIWYPDGKICQQYTYVDGDFDGPFVDYYSNGKVCKKGQYLFDELVGTVEVFQENGMPLSIINFQRGQRSGLSTMYSNGVKSKEVVFYNGYPLK